MRMFHPFFPTPQSTVQNPVCVPLRNPTPHPRDLAVSKWRKFLGDPINSTSVGWRGLILKMKITSAQSGRVSWRKHIEMYLKAQGAEVSLEISQSIVELHRASPSKAFAWVLIGWIFCYHGMRDQADFPEDFQDQAEDPRHTSSHPTNSRHHIYCFTNPHCFGYTTRVTMRNSRLYNHCLIDCYRSK